MLFSRIRLRNVFSFIDATVDLRGLNVLIGPNGAGKSNLIEVVGLLHAAPTDLPSAIQQAGGIGQVLSLAAKAGPVAKLECYLALHEEMKYALEFVDRAAGFTIQNESLTSPDGDTSHFRRQFQYLRIGASKGDVATNQSVLALYKHPADATPTTRLGRSFEQIRIYREFRTAGPFASARSGVSTSVTKDFLHDGGDNLAVVLHDLDFKGTHQCIQEHLMQFCERFQEVKTRLIGQIMGTFMQESGLREPLSAMRLSDGTLKFLCLLAVLLNPEIPPLICIEEPEVGLHPDAIRIVADALVEASQRTQLIVTTHSEALIDALSDRPESVLICERDFDNGTQFRRLDRNQLSEWLEDYTLGALWRKGELGGNRW